VKTFLGIEIGAHLRIVAFSPERGVIGRAEHSLPGEDPARSEALLDAVKAAIARLGDRLPPCAGGGIAVSPPDENSIDLLATAGLFRAELPFLSATPLFFAGVEAAALTILYGGGAGKAWFVLGDRPRFYAEKGDFETTFEAIDEKGATRRFGWRDCIEIMEPIRALRSRLGLFETLDEIEANARLGPDSAGVRFLPRRENDRYDGVTLTGIGPRIKRPQIARAALESVAAAIRREIAEASGEGALTELYVAGQYAHHELFIEIIADMTGLTVVRTETRDAIAVAAALRAAAAAGVDPTRLERRRFNPTMPAARRDALYARWLVGMG
jgi:hypothetical protein